MTLVSEIIRDAYRESNLIAITADPTSEEETEGLRLLNRIVSGTYGIDAGEELQVVPIGNNNISRPADYPYYNQVPEVTDWYVPQNSRLVLNLTASLTVYLPPDPEDGARLAIQDKSDNLATYNLTVVANGRTIGDATSVTLSTDGLNSEYFYNADSGNWAILSPLEADDTFPFPTEFEDLFVIDLAVRLNPRHGVTVDPQSSGRYFKVLKAFKARYRQHREAASELGLLRTSGIKRTGFDTRRANREFDYGNPRG
jgi:hypothetical protein